MKKQTKSDQHIKPGWTPEVNPVHEISKRAYKAWVAADTLDVVTIL